MIAALMTVRCVNFGASTIAAPFFSASREILDVRGSRLAYQRPEHHVARRGIARRQGRRLCLEFRHECVRHLCIDNDALGRHANLPLIHECPKGSGIHRRIQVRIIQNHERRLASQFEQCGLEIASGNFRNNLSDLRRPGEVHAAHSRVRDQAFYESGRVGGRVCDQIRCPGREPSFLQHLDDQRVRSRAHFRSLQHHRVAAGKRRCYRAHAQNHRRVPRRNPQYNSGRLAYRKCVRARRI